MEGHWGWKGIGEKLGVRCGKVMGMEGKLSWRGNRKRVIEWIAGVGEVT